MKRFLKSVLCWLETMGRARAAGELARAGRYVEAKNLMSEKCKCC